MIGVVVVSHSPALANAAVSLALEMVRGDAPRIAVAAGAGEDAAGSPVIGTDAVRVAEAIDEVAGPDGVLVFMDLGSAVLSAGMALELTSSESEVRLSRAPFVEGIVAGVVLAAAGATLDEADREASSAMTAKNEQLAPGGESEPAASPPTPEPVGGPGSEVVAEVALINKLGLHARPAAAIVAAMGRFDADVAVAAPASGRSVSASSLMGMMTLGAQGGAVLRITGSGSDAAEAVEFIRVMVAGGFGEE
ncbi:MAG: HPr family phosphocarrier protein [Microbacteriaceae bacterium]|nr:HPr family phosphocarrier protein [Microbacteriaceae bacterium]